MCGKCLRSDGLPDVDVHYHHSFQVDASDKHGMRREAVALTRPDGLASVWCTGVMRVCEAWGFFSLVVVQSPQGI